MSDGVEQVNNEAAANRKRRLVVLMGICFWGGMMFLLFNFTFIRETRDFTAPYFILRLSLSAVLFGVGGFLLASHVARRFGMSKYRPK